MRWLVRTISTMVVLASWLATPATAGAAGAFLTPAEQARVLALVERDHRVQAVLGDAKVHASDVLPWSADGTRETLIGGGVTLEFEELQTLEADWPLLEFEREDGGYEITTWHYRVEGADAVDAWVDLRKAHVVSFDVRDGTVDPRTVRQVAPTSAHKSSPSIGGHRGYLGVVFAGLAVSSLLGIGILLGRRNRRKNVL